MALALTSVEDEVLLRDVHPAELLLPDGQLLRNVRVFVTTARVTAWSVTPAGSLRQVADIDLTDTIIPSRNTLGISEQIEIATVEGKAFLNRAQGCGCGSPLKALPAPAPWSRR